MAAHDQERRRDLVPALLRTRRGIRSRGALDPRDPRRRRVDRRRAEGVDQPRPLRAVGTAARAQRRDGAEARGHHRVRPRPAAPGVEVRPLRQMNGDTHFTEVFLTGVHPPTATGSVRSNGGWRVALTTLAHERGGVASPGGRWLDENRLIALARCGLDRDPVVRQRLARVIVELRVASLTMRRARARARAGRPGPEGSGLKLRSSAAFRDFTDAAMAVLGRAPVAGPEAPRRRVADAVPHRAVALDPRRDRRDPTQHRGRARARAAVGAARRPRPAVRPASQGRAPVTMTRSRATLVP